MKFAVVDPSTRTVRIVDRDDLRDALRDAGLKPGEVDHGTIKAGLAIVVHEESLFARPQCWFGVNHGLYGGNAVIYAYNEAGNTIDLPDDLRLAPFIMWLPTDSSVEAAITGGLVVRPQIAFAGDVAWQWPQPPLSKEETSRRLEEMVKRIGADTIVIDGDTVVTAADPHKRKPN